MSEGKAQMLLNGVNHVALLTHDTGRLVAFYREVFDADPVLSVFFRDPDGLEGEVCVQNPDAVPGLHNPQGAPAARCAATR